MKVGKKSFLFERNNSDHPELAFFKKEMTNKSSNSLSTMVLPPDASSSEEGTYMRLEGY